MHVWFFLITIISIIILNGQLAQVNTRESIGLKTGFLLLPMWANTYRRAFFNLGLKIQKLII